jgi:hypothetical protein
MTDYVFEPEVGEDEWLDLSAGDLWRVWRSMPRPRGPEGPDRKKLLLVAHLLRQVADQLTDGRFLAVIDAGERYADGLIPFFEMWLARHRAEAVWVSEWPLHEAAHYAGAAARSYLYKQGEAAVLALLRAAGARAARRARRDKPAARQAAEGAMEALARRLINEAHGNPFRPVTLDPAWQAPQVVALAQAAYDNRDRFAGTLDPARLAALADALGGAGCDQPDLLAHLRGAGPHVRGCWAVDLLLGKA